MGLVGHFTDKEARELGAALGIDWRAVSYREFRLRLEDACDGLVTGHAAPPPTPAQRMAFAIQALDSVMRRRRV